MPPKKKAANGYKFAEALPKGEVLEDLSKKKWKLGVSIGKGGFGEIYCAQEAAASGSKYPYVIKIEPHANGPLFVERNFYINNAKAEDVQSFKKEHGLKTFGMPVYIGSGTYEYNKQKYRFLVMEKFGSDLWKLFLENNKIFPVDTVFKIAIQILDILEYIHSKGYVHADIKGANILLGASKETQDKQVYLVDFGLACKFSTEKELKPNPKKAHDGTIEYLSRDAHLGVQTRRGDLEILAYNIIQWLGCKLPWEQNLDDQKAVQASKEQHMGTISKMLKTCFGTKTPPSAVETFLKYIKTLNCDTEPDYKKIKTIFTSGIKEAGGSIGTPLLFTSSKKSPIKRKGTPENDTKGKKQRLLRNVKDVNYKDPSTSDGEGVKTIKKRARKPAKKVTKKTVTKKVQNIQPGEHDTDSEVENEVFDHSEPELVTQNVTNSRGNRNQNHEEKSDEDDGSEPELVTKSPVARNRNQNRKEKSYEEDGSEPELVTKSPVARNRNQNRREKSDEDDSSESELVAKKSPVARNRNQNHREESHEDDSEPELVTKIVSSRGNKNQNHRAKGDDSGTENYDEVYTDAMKEIRSKMQNGREKVKSKDQKKKHTSDTDDNMVGYTEEMRQLAAKKKLRTYSKSTKTKNPTKKQEILIPIATGSKASSKRGLVKVTSRRLNKDDAPPLTHGNVVSDSESDTE